MNPASRRAALVAVAISVAVALAIPASKALRSLGMTRRAVATFVEVVAASNAQDAEALRRACTGRYLREHPPTPSSGGGMVNLPRGIHPNFQAWREGDEVWLCPTDRVGPVYRFVFEGGTCRFDGLVGRLLPGGRVEESGEILEDP